MQERNLYEYAIIRLLPNVEREEFLNVGLILFCKHKKFIKVAFEVDENRLKAFAELDVDFIKANLFAFQNIANADKNAGLVATFDLPSRFRWLTAMRSSMIQTSRPHPGICENLEDTFNRIYQQNVAQSIE
ncbi:MAG: DUF3037 domain-containing protein [Flavobacterium sp.]